ncbi:MAG TPA: RNA-binding S4 domain-containing protein [Fastidiosipila sp.]|jgi:ribosomal 50S subunit-recycling heat shock protein|nr:RNA-binding S4 domain-containing protein [Eubacteriales bacterium]HHU03699.1 RNA-binding S4 domain-containing protein [Fastidiosipila sp.]
MRLDKYLKVSRIVKRRTVAKEIADAGRITVNGVRAKAGTELKVGDILEIGFGQGKTRVRVLELRPSARKEEAENLYELLETE